MLGKMVKAKLYTRYPISNVLIYNGATILHLLLGGIGIILGRDVRAHAAKGMPQLCLLQTG